LSFIKAAMAANLPVSNGLQAVEAQDRGCMKCVAGAKFTGSVNMDEAYRVAEAQSNRWDYGLGFCMANEEFAVWIEPHSATSVREVKTMLRKLQWLKDKLATDDFEMLRGLTDKARQKNLRQFSWIAHGKIGFRQGTTEAKRLAKAGLNFPCRNVTLGRD
jgi:hypothetical protein